jgi:RNA polymerase sigma-70 factor (ECF subfamily)
MGYIFRVVGPESARASYEAGRAAWPGLELPAEVHERYLARVEAGEAAIAHAADLYLACACLSGAEAAVAALDERMLSQVPAWVARIDRSAPFAGEVRQVARERLFVAGEGRTPKIGEYAARGPLAAWLRMVVLRIALDLVRARRNDADADSAEQELLASSNPELELIRQRYAGEFREAFTFALAALEARDRTLLKLHLVDGLNIDAIGRIYGVHRATVARWIAASRESLAEETRRRLQERLRVDAGELDSLFRAVRSQMDVSIRGILVGGGR